MNILLVGSGGREHALAWKIAQSPLLTRLVCAPGNPGIAEVAEIEPVKVTDVAGMVSLAQEIAADLVVIGPEAAVEAGLADALGKVGIACFGPSRAAGRLESSKAFTKDFCQRHGLATAAYGVFETPAEAKAHLSQMQPPYVIKADALAGGKGVVIAETRKAAEEAIDELLAGEGSVVVVEEFLQGEEASLFAISDGTTSMLFGGGQDHKRAYDGDIGPNTGGMGAYSPAPILTGEVALRADEQLISPTLQAMAAEGAPFKGVLYAGLMVSDEAEKLVEYNVRFGDPECQVLMLRLESDIVPYLHACATGRLASLAEPEWKRQAAICVVLASDGYPESPLTGSVIKGADRDFGEGVFIFHAGTARDPDGTLRSAGGRVLNVCAVGADLAEARERAYAAVARIDWPGGFHRTDIGWRALAS